MAFAKGVVEDGIMKLCDFTFAFPVLLSAILLTSTFGPGVVNAIIAIGVDNVPVFARLTRATANGVLSREYVLAARAAGRGPIAIAFDQVPPNIAPALIVQATIQFAIAILAEAALSSRARRAAAVTSWGRMLAEAQNGLYVAPRLAVYPGVAVALSVLGLNLLGDGLRDALYPKLRPRTEDAAPVADLVVDLPTPGGPHRVVDRCCFRSPEGESLGVVANWAPARR